MDNQLAVPIPQYPPFKLRSSLIDKDPVIWVHLLEGYIQLFQLLLSDEVALTVKSQQQLQQFLKSFLQETAEETTKIFSLGAINPDIKKNTATLRAYVLAVVRAHSIVKLGITGHSLWHFVVVYVEKNASLVRSLIDGTFKSPLNDNRKSSNISLVPALQASIETQITEGLFDASAQQVLFLLLGHHAAPLKAQTFLLSGQAKKARVLAKDRDRNMSSSLSALAFAEGFVRPEWVEMLERLYSGGRSVHAETVKNCMVISVLALSVSKLATLVSTLGINSAESMAAYPLFSSIIISDAYKALNSGLEEKLPFLHSLKVDGGTAEEEVNEKDVEFLLDMFPTLTPGKAKMALLKNDRNADKVTGMLLDDPLMIESIPEELERPEEEPPIQVSQEELRRGIERFQLSENETTTPVQKKEQPLSEDEIKKRTLSAALQMLYESDEDERDDTYDDQEHNTGVAFEEYEHKPSSKEKARLAVFEDDDDESTNREGTPQNAIANELEKTELNLFGYFKSSGESAFDRSGRKTKLRDEIKSVSKWSDEQIEGWFKMLKKSPKRFRLLEERFAEQFSNRKVSERQLKVKNLIKQASPKPDSSNQKRAHARNERQKSSRANHNRKSGHDRKTRANLAGVQQ
uniref:CUE domain-containing protein n=1 Tax=Candidozyma auris TaxID=498019 RepID=A0A0L0NVR8_CANAR